MEKINKAKYEGYIWMSDQQEPLLICPDEEFELTLSDTDNPFVIEGNLWDATNKLSIMIKYVDGKYIVRRTLVSDERMRNEPEKEFLPHRIKGVKKLLFLQCWREEKDPLCENMVALQPDKLVFIGFNKNRKVHYV